MSEDYLNESLRKIAKGAGIGFIGTFIGMALGYLSRMIIARFLGASDYGLICLGFAVMTIVAIFSLVGLPSGIIRYVSFYKGKEDKRRIKGTIVSALKISVPLSLILTLLVFYSANWISTNVFREPRLTPILRIFIIGVPFWVLTSNFIAATVGFQDLRYRVFVNDLFQNIFKLVAIVLLLLLGFGVLGAAWGWVLAIVLMPLLAFYFLEKKVFSVFNKIKAITIEKELFSFSFPLIFAGLAGLITSWTDTLMLGYFSTASDVGIYNAALPTAKLLRVFLGSFGAIFMPVASELYSRNALNDLKSTYSTVTKWVFLLILPAFLLMVLFSDWILKIMFGTEYVTGARALSILALGYLIICVIGPASQILQAYGRAGMIMGCSFFAAGVNIVLNYLLIPIYGVNGAAIATGISLTLMNTLLLFFVYKIGRIQPFRVSYIKPLFASLLAISVVYVMTKYVVGVSLSSLIGMLFVFLALYFFLLLLFKSFEEEDLMIMRAIDQRLGTKSDWVRKIIQRFL
jgi:O-antigen/teichoic acid export membrane protein